MIEIELGIVWRNDLFGLEKVMVFMMGTLSFIKLYMMVIINYLLVNYFKSVKY
jgi:hypothetical protein